MKAVEGSPVTSATIAMMASSVTSIVMIEKKKDNG
jgi:hypothetical protein